MRRMNDAEIRAFLTFGTRTGKLAVTRLDGSPMVVPIWFAVDEDDTLLFTTWGESIKGKSLRRDGRVSLCVDEDAAAVRLRARRRHDDAPRRPGAVAHLGRAHRRPLHGRRARRAVRGAQRRAGGAARAHRADDDRRPRPTSPTDARSRGRRCARFRSITLGRHRRRRVTSRYTGHASSAHRRARRRPRDSRRRALRLAAAAADQLASCDASRGARPGLVRAVVPGLGTAGARRRERRRCRRRPRLRRRLGRAEVDAGSASRATIRSITTSSSCSRLRRMARR